MPRTDEEAEAGSQAPRRQEPLIPSLRARTLWGLQQRDSPAIRMTSQLTLNVNGGERRFYG